MKRVLSKNSFRTKIYNKWKEYCNSAQEEIIIITPYLDNTINHLLFRSKINEDVIKIVYTRIDSETIFDRPYQIDALINFIKKGGKVFKIEELHAKLLIVDRKELSIGSQNFTKAGKNNKETSLISSTDFSRSRFFKEIKEWLDEAKEVKIDYLLELKKKLKYLHIERSKLLIKHGQIFDEINLNDIFEQTKKYLENVRKERQKSKIKLAREVAFLELKKQSGKFSYIPKFGENLTLWNSNKKSTDITELARINWYPAFFPNLRILCFVRLGSKTISFYHSEKRIFEYQNIGNIYFKVKLKFPQEIINDCNIEIEFYKFNQKSILKFQYDGSSCNFLEGIYSSTEVKTNIEMSLLSRPRRLHKFLKGQLNSYEKEGDLNNRLHTIIDYKIIKLYIIQFKNNPILVCE